jgi:hypothetical protein|tara:strand:+ start:205 stop:474 length:270 start_codon:yes stop_codon:yes gene_type:complete
MSRIIVSAGEAKLSPGIGNSTTVGNAKFVRVYNNSGANSALYVQDANYSGIGSITIPNGTIETIEKHPEDTIYYIGSGTMQIARVGVSA